MNCQDVRQSLPDYLYGELTKNEVKKIHQHLSNCELCLTEEMKLVRLLRAMDQTIVDSLPNDFDEKLWEKIHDARQSKNQRFLTVKKVVYAIAAMIILAIGISFIAKKSFYPDRWSMQWRQSQLTASAFNHHSQFNYPSFFDKLKRGLNQ